MSTVIKKIILGLILCLNLAGVTFGQTDTSFWFVAPDISEQHADRPIYFRFSAFEKAASVKITMPAQDDPIIKEIIIPANGEYSYLIENPELFETPEGNIKNNGILITSTTPITAYYEVAGTTPRGKNNTDIFALKGNYALGNDFIIPMQSLFSNQQNLEAQSSFEIVATEDNTQITVIPSSLLFLFPTEDTITITLDKGQTYAFRALTEDVTTNNLAGTTVTSSSPIAITATDDSVLDNNFWDLIGDQLIPMKVAGTKYVLPIGYIAISSRNDLTITVKELSFGNLIDKTYELTADNHHSITFGNNYPQLIETSDTIIVNFVDVYGSGESVNSPLPGGELGGAIIPPIACSGSREVSFIRSSDEDFYIYLVFRTSAMDSFLLNDISFPIDSAKTYSVDSNLSYIKMELDEITPNLGQRLKNTSAPFHLAIANGSPITGLQVGYFSNFRNEINDTLYACQDYDQFADYYATLDLYGTLKIDTIVKQSEDSSYVKFEIEDEYCLLIDSAWIINAKPPVFNLADTFMICNDIDSIISFEQHLVIFDKTEESKSLLLQKDSVSVYIENKAGCSATKTAKIFYLDSLKAILPNDSSFCTGDTLSLEIKGVFDSSFINNSFDTSFIATQDSIIEIRVNNKCGSATKTIHLTENKLPTINLGPDREVCSFYNQIILPKTYNYLWQDSNTSHSYTFYDSGLHTVIATDSNHCSLTDSVNITYKNISKIDPIEDSKLCTNTLREIKLSKGHDSYLWNDNINSNNRILDSGYYELNILSLVNDTVCYEENFSFEITKWNLSIPNIVTPNNDDKNETFKIKGLNENYPLQLVITNRWGKEIYNNDSYQNDWGNDDALSNGVYYYHTISEGFECTNTKGFILIQR